MFPTKAKYSFGYYQSWAISNTRYRDRNVNFKQRREEGDSERWLYRCRRYERVQSANINLNTQPFAPMSQSVRCWPKIWSEIASWCMYLMWREQRTINFSWWNSPPRRLHGDVTSQVRAMNTSIKHENWIGRRSISRLYEGKQLGLRYNPNQEEWSMLTETNNI